MSREVDLPDLILRTALSDESAFERLYQATAAQLLGVCMAILKSREEAEEVLQEAFIRIWRRADSFRVGYDNPMAWLATITRNAAIDRVRVDRSLGKAEWDPDELEGGAPSPEEQAIGASVRRKLLECLKRLPKPRAQAVTGAYIMGESYAELAARHSVPINTIRTWLRRSLISLRGCLSGSEEP